MPADAPRSTALQRAVAFGAVYVFWGATFLAIRYAVIDIPPLLLIGLRCAGGALVLYTWLALRGRPGLGSAAEWRTAALAGALLFVGCHGVMAWAEQRVTSGQTALLMTGIPIWMVVLPAVLERRAPPPRIIVALALGIAGVVVLTGGAWSGRLADSIGLVVASFAWAAGSLVGRHGSRPASLVQATAMQLAAGAVWALLASAITNELAAWSWSEVTPRAVAALGYLIVFGTALGFGAYLWLLERTTPAAASSYAFVNPLIALGLGWLAGDDTLSGRVAIAAVLVIGAVVLTRPIRSPPARAGSPSAARGGRDPRSPRRTPGRRERRSASGRSR